MAAPPDLERAILAQALAACGRHCAVLEPGEVWLVGAGPGDPKLLTLDALSALAQADVLVHDALIDPRILALAREGSQLHFAGKRAGHPSTPQGDINDELIDFARRGLRVVRLKGGDPFVFGRGAEEALALAAAGVPFRVVPGITAGLGGLASAGIPATHRGVNRAIIFATGHDPDDEGALDWHALARTGQPIVIYMGLRNLERIARALVEGGLSPDTPAAVISAATTPDQRILVSSLGGIAEAAHRAEPPAPALVVIGEIVPLRARLHGAEP
jgi:uroporphyrin-III C-methyltransferase